MPATIRPMSIYAITTRKLQVRRIADVTPGMRRVTLGGPELAEHVAANGFGVNEFRSDGFDDEFKLILPDPQTGELHVPTQNEGRLTWTAGSFSGTRTYTVRRWDAEAGELDIDLVNHGSGPATRWAYGCEVGDDIHVAGPKMSGGHPDAAWLLIAGDETALPAIGRWLEEMPAGTRAEVFIEVASADHVQELTTAADARITWLDRKGAPAGTTSLMFDALQAAPWHSDDVYAWVAGEALTLAPIRRWLRNDKGLDKRRVEVTGYWRRAADAEGADDGDAPHAKANETLHDLLEITPAVALRVASTVGLVAALGEGPAGAEALADRLGLHPGATGRLLRYLATIAVVEADDGGYRLTPVGVELDDDYYASELNLDGARAIGIVGLLASVRTGRAGYEATFGRSFSDALAGSSALAADDLESDFAQWAAEPLSRSAAISGLSDLRIAGPGALTAADALLRLLPDLRVRLLVTPSQEQAARAHDWADGGRVDVEVGGLLDPRPQRSEAFLLVDALTRLPDADAGHVLAQAAASTADGSVLLLADVMLVGEDDEHELEDDLRALAIDGGALRTAESNDALASAAGLQLERAETVGWGPTLRRYIRAR